VKTENIFASASNRC